MSDISAWMPRRASLSQALLDKMSFSASKLAEIKKTLRAAENSSTEAIIVSALADCERPPSTGETKRCVGSIKDMVEFSNSLLGPKGVARCTESAAGLLTEVLVGHVNGGMEMATVSCHQMTFSVMLYYCHSMPGVRVYEVELLNSSSKAMVNRAVAICHEDTSMWTPTHEAFVTLGYGPWEIEVCHWLAHHDLAWTLSD